VGSDRAAADDAVRGRAGCVRARARRERLGRAEELDRGSRRLQEGWTADRLGTLERNILRIGIYELEEESVPPEVAMNEAVVLAKRYASEDAARLVNGILARVAREEVRMSEAGSADEALGRAEELLERLKATREELERLAAQGGRRGGRRGP
jgi:hypothetical protein